MTASDLIKLLEKEDPTKEVWHECGDYSGSQRRVKTLSVPRFMDDAFGEHALVLT